MRCHQCNQDSIKIIMDDDVVHIKCDICALDINCGENNPLLCELFLYNEQLEDVERLGKEALIEGKDIGDNPYSFDSNQIILNKRWELGYKREKESYEFSALSLSAEKIESQLRTDIRALKEEKEDLDNKIKGFIHENYKSIDSFCSKLLKRKILGKILKKDISSFKEKYKVFHKEVFGTWESPD